MSSQSYAPINWPALSMFLTTTIASLIILPWYLITQPQHLSAWIFMFLIMGITGMSITAGYHRLWSHRSYEAHPIIQVILMLFGAMAFQNSILIWGSLHRTHHKHVDDEDKDPYSIRRGFWFAHLGWMVRNYPSSEENFSNSPDLLKNKIVVFQHKHYVTLALAMNIIFPLVVGYFFHAALGFLLLGGLLRLVINHHCTFFINSLAHMWGYRPYTQENTARDNDFLALLTFGEGYHNYHHCFQWDYRNGIKWWHFDPTKWMIKTLSYIKLTSNLKKVPNFKIQKALLEQTFYKCQEKLKSSSEKKYAQNNPNFLTTLEQLEEKYKHEFELFLKTIEEWSTLQGQKIKDTQQVIKDKWENGAVKQNLLKAQEKIQEIEESLFLQAQRIKLLQMQTSLLC